MLLPKKCRVKKCREPRTCRPKSCCPKACEAVEVLRSPQGLRSPEGLRTEALRAGDLRPKMLQGQDVAARSADLPSEELLPEGLRSRCLLRSPQGLRSAEGLRGK